MPESEFYKTVFEDNSRTDGVYRLAIKWNVPTISKGESGYVVQKITVTDTIKLIGNYSGPYYEAWKVSDGKNLPGDYDDHFQPGGYDDFWNALISDMTEGKSGIIQYDAEVYWISDKFPLHNQIAAWKEEEVSMAGELPAIMAADFHELDNVEPLFTREFIHIVKA